MSSQTELFRFVGRAEADVVVDERVVLRQVVTPPALDAANRISLTDFLQFFEQLREQLLAKHGSDCADFELEFVGGAISVMFTRPMDVVEQTQIRAYRQRLQQGEVRSDLTDEDRISRGSRTVPVVRELPDPTVASLGPVFTP